MLICALSPVESFAYSYEFTYHQLLGGRYNTLEIEDTALEEKTIRYRRIKTIVVPKRRCRIIKRRMKMFSNQGLEM